MRYTLRRHCSLLLFWLPCKFCKFRRCLINLNVYQDKHLNVWCAFLQLEHLKNTPTSLVADAWMYLMIHGSSISQFCDSMIQFEKVAEVMLLLLRLETKHIMYSEHDKVPSFMKIEWIRLFWGYVVQIKRWFSGIECYFLRYSGSCCNASCNWLREMQFKAKYENVPRIGNSETCCKLSLMTLCSPFLI